MDLKFDLLSLTEQKDYYWDCINGLGYAKESNISSIKQTIDGNIYIKNSASNKKKDINSLSYLIDKIQLSQSDCIKLGTGLEKILSDLILDNNKLLINIKSKNIKGVKEKDHLFKDDANKIIYYAEIKSNLNLDTEKCKSTSKKCIDIFNELTEIYPGYIINMFLVQV